MASRSGTLYIGITNNLARRVYEHKNGLIDGFSKKYKCKKLVYFEESNEIKSVIEREKQLKKWSRSKKIWLINMKNPSFEDLSTTLEMTG